jgi:hypothetical protein
VSGVRRATDRVRKVANPWTSTGFRIEALPCENLKYVLSVFPWPESSLRLGSRPQESKEKRLRRFAHNLRRESIFFIFSPATH